jgi:hypothetical protein
MIMVMMIILWKGGRIRWSENVNEDKRKNYNFNTLVTICDKTCQGGRGLNHPKTFPSL